jgi:cyanate lyase
MGKARDMHAENDDIKVKLFGSHFAWLPKDLYDQLSPSKDVIAKVLSGLDLKPSDFDFLKMILLDDILQTAVGDMLNITRQGITFKVNTLKKRFPVLVDLFKMNITDVIKSECEKDFKLDLKSNVDIEALDRVIASSSFMSKGEWLRTKLLDAIGERNKRLS